MERWRKRKCSWKEDDVCDEETKEKNDNEMHLPFRNEYPLLLLLLFVVKSDE